MKPSTTVRATSSSDEIRLRTCGSMNGVSGVAEGLLAMAAALQARLRDGNGLEQALDNVLGRDALRLGVEVRQDAVPQDRIGEPLDVLDRNVEPPVEQRPGLPPQDEI